MNGDIVPPATRCVQPAIRSVVYQEPYYPPHPALYGKQCRIDLPSKYLLQLLTANKTFENHMKHNRQHNVMCLGVSLSFITDGAMTGSSSVASCSPQYHYVRSDNPLYHYTRDNPLLISNNGIQTTGK